MDKWREELEDRLLDAVGEADVLAKGRVYEHKRLQDEIHITGPGSSVLVTRDEIVWSGVRGGVRRLSFSSMSGYSEAEQFHRYALMLGHEEVEFLERVPAHRILWVEWGRKWEPRSRVLTCLAFSSRNAQAAEAIRAELERRRISKGPAIKMPATSRAERTRESHLILTPKSK